MKIESPTFTQKQHTTETKQNEKTNISHLMHGS